MLNLKQEQKLQQKLSPQQIQYIKLLQLNTLDLEQRIKEEMESNPLLEEGLSEEERAEEESLSDTEEDLDDEERLEDERERELDAEAESEVEIDDEDEFDWDDLLNASDDLHGYKANVEGGGRSEDDERERPMRAESTIAEDLRDQLTFSGLSEEDELIADQIIGSIDKDGYLRRPLESIVDDVLFNEGIELEESDVEAVLKEIQQLDPTGIAARDLRECLLLQLEQLPDDTTGRAVAAEMLREHYEAFTMKHFGKLKKRLDVDDTELKAAFDLIKERLDPKPGEGSFSAQENYITPDFTVRYVDGEFVILLNGRNAPKLHISKQYRKMLEELSAEQKKQKQAAGQQNGESSAGGADDQQKPGRPPGGDDGVDEETRDFLKDKFDSARWFINSINQRRHTMTMVMDAIVQEQEDFFRHGPGHLKPMILKDIAEIIEMDISTVSRVVNGKYVQTEWGVYELKYFFSEGLETESGEEVSNKEVKAILQQVVDEEDKTNPLSDSKLADALSERGFKIARRTVSKYRKQLSIPVARLRKQIVVEEEE
ncbi:MAG: RNA polymerase sigma-54 factor [Bacteroidetes bacterium QH_8_67_23]|nr:MAG: RNA polymerase sigma-54 factor [Bacteroidetes bacterium QH_8_67_23]